jgi:hypothetical protein
MDPAERERRREAVLADIAPYVGGGAVSIRSLDVDGGLVVAAHVADRTIRPAVMQIVRKHFAGAAIKFEPT